MALLPMLAAAIGLGAAHALSPGHGKTIVAAYLVGAHGNTRHAVFLGLTVTLTHTLGVFVLGIVALFASEFILPEQLFPVISFVSGAMVFVIGLHLFISRLPAVFRPQYDTSVETHKHFREGMSATNDNQEIWHSHDGLPAHSHSLPDETTVTWGGLLGLGISGGLLPCPTATVLLLTATALDHTALGLMLVLAFSFGLALTLTIVGLIFLFAKQFIASSIQPNRWFRLLPVASAFIIMAFGASLIATVFIQIEIAG